MSLYYLAMLSIMGFIAALITLSLQRKHFLGILLSLEAATLNLFIMMFIISNNMTYEGQNSLILITLGACEASLGLAILVAVIRSKGNDYVSSFTLQKC